MVTIAQQLHDTIFKSPCEFGEKFFFSPMAQPSVSLKSFRIPSTPSFNSCVI